MSFIDIPDRHFSFSAAQFAVDDLLKLCELADRSHATQSLREVEERYGRGGEKHPRQTQRLDDRRKPR